MFVRDRNFVLGKGHKPLKKILICSDIIIADFQNPQNKG